MQARSGRGDGAIMGGIDGLVVDLVALLDVALGPDIGRQRHGAVGLDRLVKLRPAKIEFQRDLAGIALAGDARNQRIDLAIAQFQPVEQGQTLGRAGKGAPGLSIDALMQVERDTGAILAANAGAAQFGGQHAGVVDHQHIACFQKPEQVRNMPVGQAMGRVDNEEARAIARFGRMQRNPVIGKIEVEV